MEEALSRPYGLKHLPALLEFEHPISKSPGGGIYLVMKSQGCAAGYDPEILMDLFGKYACDENESRYSLGIYCSPFEVLY